MIFQQWYFDEDENMPPSIASIRLFEDKNQTRVEVIHENVPEEARENIYEGWKFNYLGAVRAFFEN
ncbi:MAG: ATPase, partial [Bacteroidales bacterium]|nr:ATPase [Bacteroidales bacterium]